MSWNNYSQERWKKADEPAMQKAIAAGGGSYIRADANDKAEQQLTDIDSLINQGAKVLIVLAKDDKGILPAIAKAKTAGIPVIAYDRLIEDDSTFYITFDNKKVGTLMAQSLMKARPEGQLRGHPRRRDRPELRLPALGHDRRRDPEAQRDERAGIKVVFEKNTDNWDTTNAKNNMEAALNANHNKIDAVLSENDSMATGVVQALDALSA